MKDEYVNKELADLYDKMQNVIRLKYVVNITAGYYPMHSRAFTLKDCPMRGGERLKDIQKPCSDMYLLSAMRYDRLYHQVKCKILWMRTISIIPRA